MLELKQEQELQQKLSPQQIQYIKLLQLNTLDLDQRIKEELEENPLLEEGLDEEEQREEEELDATAEEMENELDTEEEEEFDVEDLLNNTDDMYGYNSPGYDADEEDRDRPMPADQTLAEQLQDQISFLNLDETDEIIADQIIGSIDEDGYLRRELESIIDDILFNQGVEVTEAEVEEVLTQVQSLDPAGIAARDLQECLLLQLYRMSEDVDGRQTAIEMLEDHYEAFTMKHFDKLKKRLDVNDKELKAAFDLIRQRLDPKPGEGEFSEETNYITPDFTVRYVDGEFVITLNGRNAPDLHISRHYRKMLEKLKAQKKSDEDGDIDEETRQFLKSKFDSARWFINSINQRRHTMSLVMDAIVQLQKDFFRYGEGHLKPMILKDIAEIIDMDISTVSRVVNGKYVQTEWGVYELKYFFSEGLETVDGEEVSNKEVKAELQRIVDDEDKTDPMSDQELADALEEQGFKIARRTVSKYRKHLGIPVARLRKEIVIEEGEDEAGRDA
ncbi:RNA polymerase sigma-54 factor [Salinibacter sp. 10B]|uniref:RNA polymerase factor sigma-54 n=1 Tax=Salinibacter sp. 10B TaxID=1923971 RepID=UPI000CF4377E|nr:RNA polymerase factor sigma-54 [Salinibacter sp. 10B]PQJ35942.1 RNA polymerase sigma-54 factor [Salinibacter sp. 10B]